jgi:hypothetical protein
MHLCFITNKATKSRPVQAYSDFSNKEALALAKWLCSAPKSAAACHRKVSGKGLQEDHGEMLVPFALRTASWRKALAR